MSHSASNTTWRTKIKSGGDGPVLIRLGESSIWIEVADTGAAKVTIVSRETIEKVEDDGKISKGGRSRPGWQDADRRSSA